MNFFQKRFLTLAAFIANISLTLTVAGVATFAWYTSNVTPKVNVAATSLTIESEGPDEGLSYEILKYDDNIKAGRSYTGSEAVAQFNLPFYDNYITERNQYANVILRAEVSTSVDTSTEEFTIDITRLASSFKTAGVIGSKTSNVIQFKSTVYKYKVSGAESYTVNASSHNSIDETSAATKYATASSYFASKKTPTTFVPIRDNSDGTVIVNRKAEADTITLIPDLPSGLVLEGAIIYIECTYHDTLVSEFVKSHSESELSHSLDGDISLISFGKKTKTANQSDATGKYIKVESDVAAASGQYLVAYDAGDGSGRILKGSLATANAAINSGIDVTKNVSDVEINTTPANQPKSIDSTDTIDDDAFSYDRVAQTLKSKAGYYIGNDSNTYGIKTNSSSAGLTNDISFTTGGHALIYSEGGRAIRYYKNSDDTSYRMRYYTYTSYNDVDVYRYTENVAEMPTLVSIAMTKTPTTEQRTFYTEHYFNVNGLEVTATYSDGSTADVTSSCSFTSNTTPKTLVPEGRKSPTKFTASHVRTGKTINISYSEGGVTLSNALSYTINIVANAITSLNKTGTLTTSTYYVGETFSPAGITVNGVFNSGDEPEDVTSSCTFDGYNMSAAGTYTVTAHYGDLSIEVGTIIVRAKTLEISVNGNDVDGQTLNLYFAEQLTIKVTHTANVTIGRTGTYATPSSYSVTYSGATHASQDHNITVTAGSTAGSTVLTFSVSSPSGFTSKTVTIKVKKMPVETLTITPTHPTWSTSGYGSGSYTATTDGSSSIDLSASNVMKQSSTIQIKDGGSFQSSSTIGSYIKSIAVDYNANHSYVIYASTNGSSWTSIGTYNADHTSTFNEANGYKYFKIASSGGYTQLNSVTVQYYVVSVVDVTGIHTQPSSYYVNDTPNVNDFLLDVTMSDDTTSTVVPSSITLNTSVAGNNISGTATYSGASGTQSASFTINIINRLVTGITVNLSTSSVGVGGSATATATITPSNATNKTVTWSSSNTGVATIDASTGAISAVAVGTCTFTATANDGSGVKGTSSTFTVTASAKVLQSISVSTAPTKTAYNAGEYFSPTGLVITRTYTDSTTDTYSYAGHTSEFTFTPSTSTALTVDNKTVTISYGGKTCTQAITVQKTLNYGQTTAISTTAKSIANDSNVTIKTSSSNSYTSPLRFYANVTITITAASGYKLVSVTYVASSTGNYVTYAKNAVVSPSVTPTVNGKNITWTFTSSTTTFTFKPTSQTRATDVIVVYAKS